VLEEEQPPSICLFLARLEDAMEADSTRGLATTRGKATVNTSLKSPDVTPSMIVWAATKIFDPPSTLVVAKPKRTTTSAT
jgi:hypothetical protein